MYTMSHVQQNLRHLIAANDRGETGIAATVALPITQPKLSNALSGKRHLTSTEARAIELKFGISNEWLHKYPISKTFGLLREIKALCPDERKLRIIHRLLGIALDNATSREQTR